MRQPLNTIAIEDRHVHLHGCLTAEQLWHIGKERYKQRQPQLDWFAREYQKAWGRHPNCSAYWETPSGFDLLQTDYEFTTPGTFAQFQACFNLIIALCPIQHDDFTDLETIVRHVHAQGVKAFEARTVIPLTMQDNEIPIYINNLAKYVKRLSQELGMEIEIVFCLFRDLKSAIKNYRIIRQQRQQSAVAKKHITAIDFAFAEEHNPPSKLAPFFAEFHANKVAGDDLKLLYHVAESFADKSLTSTIRWIWEVADAGADRLGHATALGIDPHSLGKNIGKDSEQESRATKLWLENQRENFVKHGLAEDTKDLLEGTPDTLRSLQKAVCSMLKNKGVVIESCPTSNFLIGQIKNNASHPLKFFCEQNLEVLIGTDDPGVFGIDWKKEDKLVQTILQLDLTSR